MQNLNSDETNNGSDHEKDIPRGTKRPLEDQIDDHGKDNQSLMRFPPVKRFKAESADKVFTWDLPNNMLEYVNEQFHTYIPEQTIQDSVLKNNPVPNNLVKSPVLDGFIKSLMEDNYKSYQVNNDKTLGRIQSRIMNSMGPLTKLWSLIDEALTSNLEKVEVTMEDINEYVEQTITMLGQAYNNISYQRRIQSLSCIMNDTQAKQTLKDKAHILDDHNDLFGERFKNDWYQTMKTKQKCQEVLQKESGRGRYKQPFRTGPPSQRARGSGGRGQQQYLVRRHNYPPPAPNHGSNHFSGKNIFSKFTGGSPRTNSCKSEQCSPNDIKSFQKGNSSSASRGETKIFQEKLGTSHSRSKYSECYIGLQNSISDDTNTEIFSKSLSNKRLKSSRSGNTGHVEKTGHKKGQSQGGPIFEQSLSGGKEGRGEPPGNKSETTEYFRSIYPLQNGGVEHIKRYITTRRLNVQTRSKKCILWRTTSPRVKKVCEVQMERKHLRVSVPVFRTRPSPLSVYKDYENPNFIAKKTECKDYNLLRRHAVVRSDSNRDPRGSGLIDFSITASGIYNKQRKVPISTSQRNRIFRVNGEFSLNDFSSSRKQSKSVAGTMQHFDRKSNCDTNAFNSTTRETLFLSPSCITRSFTAEIFTTISNSFFEKIFLSGQSNFRPALPGRTKVVERQPNTAEWETTFDQSGSTSNDNTNRCLNSRLGSLLPRKVNRGEVVNKGTKLSHQHSRTFGSETSNFEFYKTQEQGLSFTSTNRQYDSSMLSLKNGGNKEPSVISYIQTNLGLPIKPGDNNYCRVSTKQSECGSRLGVTESHRFQRLAIRPQSFPGGHSNSFQTGNRFICVTPKSPNSQLLLVESRSQEPRHRFFSTVLGRDKRLCFSPIFTNKQDIVKGQEGQVFSHNNNTCLANSTLVHNPSEYVNSKSNFITSESTTPYEPSRPNSSISSETTTKISGLDHIRESLSTTGLSKGAVELISGSRREGTISNYESAWRKFCCWCSEQKIDPFRCDLTFVLNYLAVLFNQNYEYNTINLHRSAISAYHDEVDCLSVGKHPKVVSLMTGVFNKRPPKPKYTFIWDVEVVLKYISNLKCNEQLSLKELTHKLTMLLALTAASRSSEIYLLNINFMIRKTESYIFSFDKLTKTWKKGQSPPTIEFMNFPENPKLCVVKTLDDYINLSKQWRLTKDHSQLLLSTLKPHKPVAKSTIAGWMKSVLKNSGIDTTIFSAHSTRSASTSKAQLSGLSISDILKRGNWSRKSTWQKHYKNFVKGTADSFQSSLGVGTALN